MAFRSLMRPFGSLRDGRLVQEVCLEAPEGGLKVSILTFGATVRSVVAPGRGGVCEEVTLCHETMEAIEAGAGAEYFGATVGRVANRIAGGRFAVDGVSYQVAKNDDPNSLHGGKRGLNHVVWDATTFTTATSAGVAFKYDSHDGEEGFPGNVSLTATYQVCEGNKLTMQFNATTDAPTPINMCNHTYWNLSGGLKRSIRDHTLRIDAGMYLPSNGDLIPEGVTAPVEGTHFDFTTPHVIGSRIDGVDGGGKPGYDHCYARVAAGAPPTGPLPEDTIAVLEDGEAGRRMTVSTNQPGVQFYTGNFLGDRAHMAMCLETQAYPDSVNQAAFPGVILRPSEEYNHTTTHTFEVLP